MLLHDFVHLGKNHSIFVFVFVFLYFLYVVVMLVWLLLASVSDVFASVTRPARMLHDVTYQMPSIHIGLGGAA